MAGDDTQDTQAERGAPASKPQTTLHTLKVGPVDVPFDIAANGTGPAYFALGIRKSGSTLLYKIMSFLAARNDINVVDVPGTFFRKGLVAGNWQTLDLSGVIQPANLYLGFRALPPVLAENPDFIRSPKVFMFRDPRDGLVSQYFSDAFSHSIPSESDSVGEGREIVLKKRAAAQATDIDEYVVKHARNMGNTLGNCARLLSDPMCLVLRYEDFVFQKRRLVSKVIKHFGWKLHPAQMDRLMELVDQVPQTEDKMKFVRKAVPGDHRLKLKPETIRRLDRDLATTLETFDYC